jgi:hypothetical protein
MLARLTRTNRLRAAIVLALFYAVCSIAPAAAFAFGDATRAAHCLTGDDDHGLHGTQPHQHSNANAHADAGASHEHGNADSQNSDDHGKMSDSNCCGLICVPALAVGMSYGSMPDVPRSIAVSTNEGYGTGQIPPRLDRPPNYPLSH